MTPTAFIDAVRAMAGLRSDITERFITLAPHMTDLERTTTLQTLIAQHEEIKKDNAELVHVLDEQIADMSVLEKTTVRTLQTKEEKAERAAAEDILDGDRANDGQNTSAAA